ncbi:MAG: Uma2 family endonuclease [Longimicrobiales bacterium]
MLYVPNAERHLLTDRGCEGRPGLVVEVVSPSSVRIDKVKKPARYVDFGIPEYWVLDPDRLAVLVWRFDLESTEPRVEERRFDWQPGPGVAALTVEVRELFEAP